MTVIDYHQHTHDQDFSDLVLDTVKYRYELKHPRHYQHQGATVAAIEFTVESDLHHADVFAVQTIDARGAEYNYYSNNIAAWPQPVRRLYRAHMKALQLESGNY